MSPKSLFTIILKAFGIFLIKDIVVQFLTLLTVIPFFQNGIANDASIYSLLFGVIIFVIYGAVAYQLIFKSEWIIQKLKLDEGFKEETFVLNISAFAIVNIAIIAVGCYILVTEIPLFFSYLFYYIQRKNQLFSEPPSISYTLISAVKIILGLLLIGERNKIATWADRKNAPTEMDKSEEDIL